MPSATRLSRSLARTAKRAIEHTTQPCRSTVTRTTVRIARQPSHIRRFTCVPSWRLPGLMPDTEHPEPPNSAEVEEQRTAATLEDEEYHALADDFLNNLYERAEQVVEQRDDVEVDYSAGVLTITMPPNGSYVINKQPPNKQIWLSSPISGPKRFDWSIAGESMDQKEGTGTGEWIYLRDGSSLVDVLRKELGIDATVGNIEEDLAKKSTDPVE